MNDPVARRINAERISLLAWSRAILLQLAHPLVAAGVAEHSSFREGRLTAVRRLHHTVGAMLSLTFGSDEEREAALDRINGIHRRINGTLRHSVGPFAAGTQYSAEDPALLLWVHATLLDSIPLVFERLVAPLTDDERDRYCQEAEPVVQALGAREGAPRSWADLRSYMDRVYASGEIVVSADARDLATAVLKPPFASVVMPATRVNWLFTVGLLPHQIRTQYGFNWTASDERALERWTAIIRRVRPWLPEAIALWPQSRR